MTYMPATLCLLNNQTITAAQTNVNYVVVKGLARAKSIGFHGLFTYGSAGTTCKAYVQTSFDGGASFWDVICFSFTTASAQYYANISGLTPVTWGGGTTSLTQGTLANNTVVDGVVGDQWRVQLVTTGNYADNTHLAVFATARD